MERIQCHASAAFTSNRDHASSCLRRLLRSVLLPVLIHCSGCVRICARSAECATRKPLLRKRLASPYRASAWDLCPSSTTSLSAWGLRDCSTSTFPPWIDALPSSRERAGRVAALDHCRPRADLPPAGYRAWIRPGVVLALIKRREDGALGRRPDRARLGSSV